MDERVQRISLRAYEIWELRGRPTDHEIEDWLEAEREIESEMGSRNATESSGGSANEGEGSQTGARNYNARTKKFVKSGQVDAKAREAEDALNGPEAADLRAAEEIGKSHSHGEDPALKKDVH